MAKKIFGVLLDVRNEKFEAIEIEDTLDELYRVCDCTCIDMPVRKIGRKYFTLICDDEGLCKTDPKISAIDNLGRPQLVGNLFIVSAENADGELQGLTKSEAAYIMKRIKKMYTNHYPKGYPMLTQCEY